MKKFTVYQVYNPDKILVDVVGSMAEASRIIGVSREAVRMAVKHDRLCKKWYVKAVEIVPIDNTNFNIFEN